MEKKIGKFLLRVLIYLIGLTLIALGINISKLSGLGISPVSSVPRAIEVLTDNKVTMGVTTWIVYAVLIALQIVVLRKNYKPIYLFGILVTLVFGFFVDLTGTDPNAVGHLLVNFPKPETYIMKLVYLLVSLVLIGFGVFVYLRPKLIPMPAEGLASALSIKTGKSFGDCKTIVDTSLICIALALQFICLGGFRSFGSSTVIVREGTILAAVCVGQIVKLFTKYLAKPFDKVLGIK